ARQRRTLLPGGAAIATALAVGLGTQVWPRTSGAPPETALAPTRATVPTEAGQMLLVSDSLADPSNAAFPRSAWAATTATFRDAGSATYQWDYAYVYSAIVAHVLGPYPANPDARGPARTPHWISRCRTTLRCRCAAGSHARQATLPSVWLTRPPTA